MKESVPLFEYVFSAVDSGLLIVLTVLLFKYRRHLQFPAFTAYVACSGFSSLGLLVLLKWGSSLAYFYCYWAAEVLLYALVFCVVNEVFESLTARVKWLSRRGKAFLIRASILAAAIAVAASLEAPQSRYPVMEAVVSLQRGFGLAIFSFMGIFVVFARIYSVEWRSRDNGIAIGIFVAYSFEALSPTLYAYLRGYPEQTLYRWMVSLLGLVASVIWLYTFWRHDSGGDGSERAVPERRLAVVSRKI